MPVRKNVVLAAIGTSLICLTGCGLGSSENYLEPSDSAAASALLTNTWKPGTAFLIDREERLLLTTNRQVDQEAVVEVAFSVVENGKVVARKADWLSKARPGKTVKGKVLIADPDRDLAIVQLTSLPEGVAELKLAKADPEKAPPSASWCCEPGECSLGIGGQHGGEGGAQGGGTPGQQEGDEPNDRAGGREPACQGGRRRSDP